ncbi:esterase B1-like [Topomyia yanbarensis]|uniref:esterase B1-like n=1 Tax=Topomyia yanbarensis TaxID=2498891 RepID=UPI00273B6C46|nr:esterase B1-like [Topomyia yanbarensis]
MVMRSSPLTGWKNVSTGSDAEAHRPPTRIAIQVAQGYIYGVRENLPNGENYFYFKGVPYAKPPIGNLRFMSPVPIEKYSVSYLDCTTERSNCMGLDVLSKDITGSEDGLYLNIYTPRIPRKGEQTEKLPVMVFLHGGGLIGGHADSSMYLPSYLLQEGVLVVTVNYRLGVLGFLCLPQAGVEGNAGLKDQRMALQWVNQNIAQFGGDPDNVTLFGASSGAIAVNFHCLSKASKKYFHKGIMQSGSIYTEFGHQDEPEIKARHLASLLGYSPTSDEEVFQILKNAPARKLFELQHKVINKRELLVEKLFQIPFLPVIERESSPDAIITKHPSDIMSEPDSMGIPIILGYNEHDGMMVLIDAIKNLNSYNLEPERFIPRILNIDCYTPEARKLGNEIKQFYFKDKNVTRETLLPLTNLFTDKYLFAYRITSELWAKYQTKTKMFGYRFSFDGLLNKGKAVTSFTSMKGAAHIDEVYYLFSSPILKTEVPKTNKAYAMRQKMVRMWTNFAKYGDPTPDGEDSLPFRWEPVENIAPDSTDLRQNILSIGEEIKMMEMPERKRMDFWTELFRKYNGHVTKAKIPTAPTGKAEIDMNNNV